MKRYTIPRTAHCESGALAMTRMPDFEREIRRDLASLLARRHGAPQPAAATQAPAPQPVNLAPSPQGGPVMSLSSIAGDIKDAVENADQWVKVVAETHLPTLLAAAAKYEGSPIVQALESAMLPPEVEATIADMIAGRLAAKYPAPASIASDGQQAPAEPAAPAQ